MGHCFLGSADDEETAHLSPFLGLFGSETEAIYAIAVPDKSSRLWIVQYVSKILKELGYIGV